MTAAAGPVDAGDARRSAATPLHALDAPTLSAAFAARTLSPVDVVESVIAHVARCEPALCATYAFDPDGARVAARESDARWRRGDPRSPLDGVPVTLKENIATRGTPVPLGTAATELVPAPADAPPAARLREAGAVLVAKTTMPDWGMLSSGLSSFHRLARNPWDTDRNPGGSSAGAAAAAAAGYGAFHVGTDIGGSIRLPAGWCGVVGFKPSLGRVPIQPPYAGRVAGPLARTVADVAWAMRALARPDWRDAMSLPTQDLDWLALDDFDVKGLRLGLLLDAGWGTPLSPAVREAVVDAARRFEAAGARVEPMAPFATRTMADGMDRFWRMRSWLDFQKLPPARQALVLPYIRGWIARGATLSGAEVFEGYSQMGALRDAAVAACQPFDFVLSPVSPDVAFAATSASPLDDPERPFEHIAFTLPYNMSEQPAVSINAAYDAQGLPIGLQLVGHRHDDVGVLRLARAWERLRGSQRAWPEGPFATQA
jgi:Asp-tRNA(Asn)/Glu-tRNA(Gln) amidotransferase A subunit family amidase